MSTPVEFVVVLTPVVSITGEVEVVVGVEPDVDSNSVLVVFASVV